MVLVFKDLSTGKRKKNKPQIPTINVESKNNFLEIEMTQM